MFIPRSFEPNLRERVVSKVQRWELYLSRFDYNLEYIQGTANVFAYMLTRWTKGYRAKAQATLCSSSFKNPMQLAPSSKEVEWPKLETITKIQIDNLKRKCESAVYCSEEGVWKVDNRKWFPEISTETKLKLIVCAHCGIGGHRDIDATESILKETFFWKNMKDDVKSFTDSFLYCILSRAGSMIPWPLLHAMHASKPHQMLHLDFLFMGTGIDDKKYFLILKDDLSSYN